MTHPRLYCFTASRLYRLCYFTASNFLRRPTAPQLWRTSRPSSLSYVGQSRGSSTLCSFAACRAVGLAEAGLFICVNLRPSAVCFCFAACRAVGLAEADQFVCIRGLFVCGSSLTRRGHRH